MTQFRDKIRNSLMTRSNYDVDLVEMPANSFWARLFGVKQIMQIVKPSERLVDSIVDLAMEQFGRVDPTVVSCPNKGKMKLESVVGNLLTWRQLDARNTLIETIHASSNRFGAAAVSGAILSFESHRGSSQMGYPETRVDLAGESQEPHSPSSSELHQGVGESQE